MATGHSTSKAQTGRNRTPKAGPAKRRFVQHGRRGTGHGKVAPAQVPGAGTLDQVVEKGRRIRIQRRLEAMIRAEIRNLDRVEALLRCLKFAMEHVDLSDEGAPYFPDVVEVAADLAQRSSADLQELEEGRIPEVLMARLRVER
jgi:hypothetical protein